MGGGPTEPDAGHPPFGDRREHLVLAIRSRAHERDYAFFLPFLAGFAFDQTPSIAPAGSTKIPIMPFFPMSIRGTTTLAPAFSALAIVFLTSSTSTYGSQVTGAWGMGCACMPPPGPLPGAIMV